MKFVFAASVDATQVHTKALEIRDDVAFFQAVRAALAKRAPGEQKTEDELDHSSVFSVSLWFD